MANNSITIRTEPEVLEQVNQLAEAMDRSPNWVVNEALKSYIENQTWFAEQVREGIASLNRREGVPHEQVVDKMEALSQEPVNLNKRRRDGATCSVKAKQGRKSPFDIRGFETKKVYGKTIVEAVRDSRER